MLAPTGCSSPHNMIDDAPQSKLGVSALIGCGSPHGETIGAPRIKIGMSAPTGCSSPHNMIDGAPQSKLGASAPIGYSSPHGETVGAPQSERRGALHSKSGSIGACLLSTRRPSWVHVPSVPPFLARSGQRPSATYLHQRPAAPYFTGRPPRRSHGCRRSPCPRPAGCQRAGP